MMKNNDKTPNSTQKRASRERFYQKLSSQRKMLSKETKDLRTLEVLKSGFAHDDSFELSETDRISLDKHNSYMETTSSSQINSVQSDIRLTAAISRGK